MKSNFSKFTVLLIIILTLVSVSLNADEVNMKNGDRISGDITKMEEGKLVINTSYAGDIEVSWAEIDKIKSDPDDNKVLECALEANANYIVTGDTHLLELGLFEKIKIVTQA